MSKADVDLAAVATGVRPSLAAVLEDLADDLGRPPLSAEVAHVLAWALAVADPTLVAGASSGMTIEVSWAKGAAVAEGGHVTGDVDDVGDAAFSDAVELIGEVAASLSAAAGEPPTAQAVCDVLALAMRSLDDDALADAAPADVARLTVRRDKRQARTAERQAEVGDVVAIPVGKGSPIRAVVLARNRFGIAVGLVAGTGPPWPRDLESADVDPHPFYTDDEAVRDGRWEVIGHAGAALRHLPADPEIFHRQYPDDPNPVLGPFGSGETASGTLRPLSEEEAAAVGLLDGSYRQTRSSGVLELFLADRSRADLPVQDWPP